MTKRNNKKYPKKLTELTCIAFFKASNKEYHIRLKTRYRSIFAITDTSQII